MPCSWSLAADAMHGMDEMREPLFTTVKLEDFVPPDSPAATDPVAGEWRAETTQRAV